LQAGKQAAEKSVQLSKTISVRSRTALNALGCTGGLDSCATAETIRAAVAAESFRLQASDMGSGLVGGKARASLSSLATIGKSLLATGDGASAAGAASGASMGAASAKRSSVVFGIDDEDEDDDEDDEGTYRPPADSVGGADGDTDDAAGGRLRSAEAKAVAGASAEQPLHCRQRPLSARPLLRRIFVSAFGVRLCAAEGPIHAARHRQQRAESFRRVCLFIASD
jgi:hypothetical protein